MAATTRGVAWFERDQRPEDVMEARLVELSYRDRTLECGNMALRRKLANAGCFWKVDSWEADVMPLPRSLACRVDVGRRRSSLLAESSAHCMPTPASPQGQLVGLVWRRALRAYVVESSAPSNLDAFEFLPESLADAHAARSWGEFERGVRAHYAHEHGVSRREASALEACAPFLRELTDVIVHRRSAHVVFDRMKDAEMRMAGVHAVGLALELLAASLASPDAVLLEGWNGEAARVDWTRAVPLTRVRRLS